MICFFHFQLLLLNNTGKLTILKLVIPNQILEKVHVRSLNKIHLFYGTQVSLAIFNKKKYRYSPILDHLLLILLVI
jgi:hypothetical protein